MWLFFIGLAVGGIAGALGLQLVRRVSNQQAAKQPAIISELIQNHFHPVTTEEMTISERRFPTPMRADLQRACDRLFSQGTRILHYCGARQEYSHLGITLSGCLASRDHNPAVSTPLEFEEVDIGNAEPVRVVKTGLWFLEQDAVRFVVLMGPTGNYDEPPGIQVQIGVPNSPDGFRVSQEFFRNLETAMLQAESYRGKILSLESSDRPYSGTSSGLTVHKLRSVERDQVILPEKTLKLLERNVIQFVRQRERLSQYQQATKKGVLFYGPPGTGKTHTIHYLARALDGHTTLLISAEQVGLLSQYMVLARLLQPSMVVIEDVDLIARDRESMQSPCEEVLLNKLLNEMDGLKEDADILFVLTTNRPQALEAALASRPGRIDQAIEFPLPDAAGRRKLVVLYAKGARLSDDILSEIVRRTEGVSASFIKELLRRIVQFHIERDGDSDITRQDVDSALDELLFGGGTLNLTLLGAIAPHEMAAVAGE